MSRQKVVVATDTLVDDIDNMAVRPTFI